jgi:hypothetical protein
MSEDTAMATDETAPHVGVRLDDDVDRELARIALGRGFHRLGHELSAAGDGEGAIRTWREAARHGNAEAELHLEDLEFGRDRGVLACAAARSARPVPGGTGRVVALRRRRRPAGTVVFSSAAALVAVLAVVVAALMPGSRTAPRLPVDALAEPSSWATEPVAQASRLQLPAASSPGGANRTGPAATARPAGSATAVRSAEPALNASAAPGRELVSGSFVLVGAADTNGRYVTAIAPLGRGKPEISLRTTPGTTFVATLWSSGAGACTWRFTGRADPARVTGSSGTPPVLVAPGKRQGVEIPVQDWPILAVQVEGDRPEECLMIGYHFAESGAGPNPTPRGARTSPAASGRPSGAVGGGAPAPAASAAP